VVAKVRKRLAVNKQRYRFYMERLNLKELNEVDGKEHVMRSQIGSQLWKIWMKRWKLIVPGI
jgi:hypothetical protein